MPDVAPSLAPDPARCPLCAGGNGCAMEQQRRTGVAQLPCWCTRSEIPADVLDRIPEPARGKACICAACAGRARP